MTGQLRLDVRVLEIAVGDDSVREARPIGEALQPGRLVDGVRYAERGLHVDGLRYVGVAGLADVVVDQVVEALQRVPLLADVGMVVFGLELLVEEVGVVQVPEVKVRVHKGQLVHRRLPVRVQGAAIICRAFGRSKEKASGL